MFANEQGLAREFRAAPESLPCAFGIQHVTFDFTLQIHSPRSLDYQIKMLDPQNDSPSARHTGPERATLSP